MKHDRLGRASVEPFRHGPHLPGADHLEEPGCDEHVDVVRDRALRLPDAVGQLGHGHRPLEHEIEHEHPDRLAQRLHPLGRVGDDAVVEVVVERHWGARVGNGRHPSNDRHLSDHLARRFVIRAAGQRIILATVAS